MIVRSWHRAGLGTAPYVGLQLCPLPLSGSEVKTVQDFSNFFSYKTKIKNKGGLGRTWAIEHLRLILVLRKENNIASKGLWTTSSLAMDMLGMVILGLFLGWFL